MLLVCLLTCCQRDFNRNSDVPQLSSVSFIDRNGMSETINNPERLEQYTNVNFLEPQPYQKILRIYTRDDQGNIRAYITNYHSNGYPRQYLEVVNSRAFGLYQEWYPSGQIRIVANVIEGEADLTEGAEKSWIFDECSRVWDDQGNVEATIPYVKGKLEGVSLYYHPNGTIWKSIPYYQGAINGIVEIYCDDGMLLQRSNYRNGVKEGNSCRWWSCDTIAYEEVYCEGYLSSGRYYDHVGNLICSIDEGNGFRAVFGRDRVCEMQEYRYGLLEGEIQVFDIYGRIISLYHVKNGRKHGEEMTFYDAPPLQKELTPKLSINWFEGKIQGVTKTWYPNGIQESQKEMSNNKKNGHHSAWYRDGTLMMIEEYEQDRVVRGKYYNRGEKWPVSTIEDGKGVATLFDADGNLKKRVEYRHGHPEVDE